MRKFYTVFPNSTTLSCKLSWSHYQEILKLDDPLEISFYVRECENAHWSVRELKRQRDSMLLATSCSSAATSYTCPRGNNWKASFLVCCNR